MTTRVGPRSGPSCSKCEQRPAAWRLGTSLCLLCAGLLPPLDPEEVDKATKRQGDTHGP
jgi:hypothetical protein